MAMNRTALLANPPFELSDADKRSLSQSDEDFVPESWESLKAAICEVLGIHSKTIY